MIVLGNVKDYRIKTKPVTAMRTYLGQPLHEIREFMLGCKNIYVSLSDVHEGFVEDVKGNGSRDLSPGDYIVMSEDRNAMFMSPEEFESRYEERVNDYELHYVIRTYGFSIEDAEYMLRDVRVKAILLAPLHELNKASERANTTTIHNHISENPDDDIGQLVTKKMRQHFG